MSKKRDSRATDEHATQQDCSGIPAKTQVNLFCCPVIFLLSGESKNNMICERLTPSAPPHYEI